MPPNLVLHWITQYFATIIFEKVAVSSSQITAHLRMENLYLIWARLSISRITAKF